MPYCDADTLYYHHDKYYAETVYELNRLAVRSIPNLLCVWYPSVCGNRECRARRRLGPVVPFESMWNYVAIIFAAAGMLIGVGGSLSAIRKFLQV